MLLGSRGSISRRFVHFSFLCLLGLLRFLFALALGCFTAGSCKEAECEKECKSER